MTVKTIRIKNKSSAEPSNEREVRLIIILLSLFASAMIFGAGSINLTNPSSEIINILEYCLTTKNELSLFKIIFNSFCSNTIPLVLIFLSGFSYIGIPFTIVLFAIKGLSLGYIAGYLFSVSAKGIGYYLVTIFPANIIYFTILIINVLYSYIMTKDIVLCISDKKKLQGNTLKNYTIRFLIIMLLSVTAALIEGIFTKLYFYLFSF